jgi:hypothetical protein
VRGSLHRFVLADSPPHPDSRCRANPTSPRKRGEVNQTQSNQRHRLPSFALRLFRQRECHARTIEPDGADFIHRGRIDLKRIKEELRRRMHEPIPEQGAWLKQVVRGFFAYLAVPTNGSALGAFILPKLRKQHQRCLISLTAITTVLSTNANWRVD